MLAKRFSCMGLNTNDQPCKHFHFNLEDSFSGKTIGTCDAFPNGIPYEILSGEYDHTKPYPNDNNIFYEPLGINEEPQFKKPISEQLNKESSLSDMAKI